MKFNLCNYLSVGLQSVFRIWLRISSTLFRHLKEISSLIEWVTWLEDLLAELDFWADTCVSADIDAQGALRQLLREIVLTESVVGARSLSFQSFMNILGEGARYQQVVSSA